MESYNIAETYTLPSLGKVYTKQVNPVVKLRSMTTEEEMRRLSPSDRPYKNIADIIDDCLIEDPGISAYDMCLGDYQFLLHKLRIVTYGSDYTVNSVCPYCGCSNTGTINLEDLEVFQYSEDLSKYFVLTLPRANKKIKLRMQTPRQIDDINLRAKELRKKSPNYKGDPAFLFTLTGMIETVNDEIPNPLHLEEFVKQLPMMDTNYILKHAEKLTERIGLNTTLLIECDVCTLEYQSPFRTTSEFFGPSINI